METIHTLIDLCIFLDVARKVIMFAIMAALTKSKLPYWFLAGLSTPDVSVSRRPIASALSLCEVWVMLFISKYSTLLEQSNWGRVQL